MNLFEYAARSRVRFQSARGSITVEDLWQLNLAELNEIAKRVNREEVKPSEEESFLKTDETNSARDARLKLAIVVHIIEVKQDEIAEAKERTANRQRKQHLLEILNRKKESELEGKSVEEIERMIDAL